MIFNAVVQLAIVEKSVALISMNVKATLVLVVLLVLTASPIIIVSV